MTGKGDIEKYKAEARELAFTKYGEIFKGVDEVTILDVPDYANPGDSAIFLGLCKFLETKGIAVRHVLSRGTLMHDVIRESRAVAFVGGGSFGGLSPESDEVRIFVAEKIPSGCVFIQCPQSVVFKSAVQAQHLVESLRKIRDIRLAARDKSSFSTLVDHGLSPLLAPDSSIFLDLDSTLPTIPGKVAYLVRNDAERTGIYKHTLDHRWNNDNFRFRVARRIRLAGRYSELLASFLNPKAPRWERIADIRLRRALDILGDSEIVLTNRLHGMLLSWMLGKKTVYFDNANGKLSSYANTWLESAPNLYYVANLESGLKKVESLRAN